jgi:hypothetical protein
MVRHSHRKGGAGLERRHRRCIGIFREFRAAASVNEIAVLKRMFDRGMIS